MGMQVIDKAENIFVNGVPWTDLSDEEKDRYIVQIAECCANAYKRAYSKGFEEGMKHVRNEKKGEK